MFTPGGQIELRLVAAYGGKGGSSSRPATQEYVAPAPTVLTDPVTGKTFIQNNDPYSANYGTGASAQDQLNAEIAERQATEKATSDKAAADKTASDAAAETSFQGRRQSAYDNALQQVMRQFQLQGADPSKYMDTDITPALQRQYNSVQDLDPNPTAAFPTSTADTLIGNILSGKRTQATNALNSIFKPTYAQEALPDTLTNQYKGTILDEQFTPLQAQLENAQRRGTLADSGYQAAQSALGQRRSAADATLMNLGTGILAADRSGINDYISGARSDVNSLGLAGDFDPNVYSQGAQNKVSAATGSFGGALRNAVGDTKFADITDLLNAGGAVQGAQNPNAAGKGGAAEGGGQLSPSFVSEEELANRKRGLGNSGAF